ncbi:MAG: hypothetical protein AAFY71_24605 [Bacteroidota bacterium]
MSDWFHKIPPESASVYIDKALSILKKQGISQSEVEYKIDFTNLSKARNFLKYRNLKSDLIGGQSLGNILNKIFDAYPLELNEQTNTVQLNPNGKLNGQNGIEKTKDITHYVYYYYTDSVKRINKGIILFKSRGEVELRVFSPVNITQSVSWYGTFRFGGMYLFIEVQTGDTNQFKSMHSYFSGIPRIWQNYYVGIYNGIRADGTLLVGKSLLQKVESREAAYEALGQETDPIITNFLEGEILSVKTKVIQDLSSL